MRAAFLHMADESGRASRTLEACKGGLLLRLCETDPGPDDEVTRP